jgi:5'-3' exonuclease
MGIKHLNRFLKENSSTSIKFVNIAELSGKKIAVDISIYMYRYASDDNLIENMYLMLSVFRHYNIIPIFIFDGKPPPEKRALLIKRKENREEAQEEYNKLREEKLKQSNIRRYNMEFYNEKLKQIIKESNKRGFINQFIDEIPELSYYEAAQLKKKLGNIYVEWNDE